MIKTLKRLSFKLKRYYLAFLRRIESFFPLRIVFLSTIFAFFYIFLPLELTYHEKLLSGKLLFVFYLTIIAVAVYLFKKHSLEIHRLEAENEGLQEAINIQDDQNLREEKNTEALGEKISRYNTLKEIIEDINENLNLDAIGEALCLISYSLIGRNQGCCILYLLEAQKLNLFKSLKEDKELVIKAKEGDIFDHWVIRHATPLFISDIRKDFRFDLEKIEKEELRGMRSLVSAPFISDHQFLGILRLDNRQAEAFAQDDLRFLVAICDLGAVALENGQLFQKTQNLAIHDGLTWLYTKGYFFERLKEECKRGLRQKRPFSLLMLDIDFFKNYNDKFGHTAGDLLLKSLSQDIIDFFKDKSALISRFGGEEFCVILPNSDKKSAHSQAEELRRKIENKKITLRRQETGITVSIGVATFGADATDEVELIIKVDRAMYEAKQKGRNRVADCH